MTEPHSKPETARPVQDLPLYWQGRANALRMLEERRLVPDRATIWQADAFEECANELRAALAIPAQSKLPSDVARRLDRECLETLNISEDGDPDAHLIRVLKRGFAAMGWAQPSLAAADVIDAILRTCAVPPQDSEALDHRLDREYANGVKVCLAILGDFNVRNDSNDAVFKMMEKIARDRIEGSRPWTAVAKPSHSQEVTTQQSWYCIPCAVEVYATRCPHCGKTKRAKR